MRLDHFQGRAVGMLVNAILGYGFVGVLMTPTIVCTLREKNYKAALGAVLGVFLLGSFCTFVYWLEYDAGR